MSVYEREQPGRSPKGPAPLQQPPMPPPTRPDDRALPVRAPAPIQQPRPTRTPSAPPVLPHPTGPPLAPLTPFGYWGDIQAFNRDVQQKHQEYMALNGVPPDPKTMLRLVTAPTPQQDRKPQAGELITRPDGVRQPHTPFYETPGRQLPDAPLPAPNTLPKTHDDFLRKYPMTPMGMLPIPSFEKLVRALQAVPSLDPGHVEVGGLGATRAEPGSTAAQIETLNAANQQQQAAKNVATIRQAQTEQNKVMGTNLPVTGVWNQTWATTVTNWSRTVKADKANLAYAAKEHGMSVPQYVKSWENQRKHIEQGGFLGHFYEAMPVQLFGHGGIWTDLASIPAYLKGSSNNPLNVGLHGLTRSAGLTLGVIGGTVQQAKADLAFGTTLTAGLVAKQQGSDRTLEEIKNDAREQLNAHPSWLRMVAAGALPVDETGWLKHLDDATNVVADLVLLRKPSFTGEIVASGSVGLASRSTYLQAASTWAYRDLARYGKDGIGRASSRLESGSGARELVARAAPLVKNGSMPVEQFQAKVAELYAHGWTRITYPAAKEGAQSRSVIVRGALLDSLRTRNLPTPGAPGRAWLRAKDRMRTFADDNLTSFKGSSSAVDFASTLRASVFAHAVPSTLGYFDKILPENVFNFVIKNKLGDDTAQLANQIESQLVRFQGTNNVRGIQQIQRKLQQLYFDKNKVPGSMIEDDPFNAVLSTEAPSVFRFPGGAQPELEASLKGIEGLARRTNNALNRVAKIHGRIILSGLNPVAFGGAMAGGLVGGPVGAMVGFGVFGPGMSLFWKHTIADTLRAEAGGGGVLTSLDPAIIRAKRQINLLAGKDPEMSRRLGVFREKARVNEANWALGKSGNSAVKTFDTGERFGDANYMEAAGAYLRRHLDDPALHAYQGGNPQDMVDLVLHNQTYRAMWKAAKREALEAEFGKATVKAKSVAVTHYKDVMTAEDYAGLLTTRYKSLSDSLAAQNLTLDDAKAFYNTQRGTSDKDLGHWIASNEVDFPVLSGQVKNGGLDGLSSRWIGEVVMRPNKWNRGRFAENQLAKTYSQLREAGFSDRDALETSTSVATALTKYHMLDFANRLQVEQDLRWVSYFATKHRLYFKWVLGTFLRHPGYAVVLKDFENTLNDHGGWTLPFKVAGTGWQIPLERLVWIPGREYDETSPVANLVFDTIRNGGSIDQAIHEEFVGGSGQVVTRSDVATVLGTKLLKIHLGLEAATYGYATEGLAKSMASRLNTAINEYQLDYYNDHGTLAPEDQAVKLALMHATAEEYWRANVPFPVVPDYARTDEEKLQAEFMANPAPDARAKFLRDHPGFSDHFGVYTDPKVYTHNLPFFRRWARGIDAYRAGRAAITAEYKRTGEYTTGMEKDRRFLSAALNKLHDTLLKEDAKAWGIETHDLVPDGSTIRFGPWGKIVNKDPFFDPSHQLSLLYPKLGSKVAALGPLQKQMQAELNKLSGNYPTKTGMTKEQVSARRVELLQKLQVFRSFPTDALGEIHDKYQKQFVDAYWKGYDKHYAAAQKVPSAERATMEAKFRAWRDEQDHPVKVDGVEFPSPVRMYWATMNPVTRKERLTYLSSKPLIDLAGYELDLLGVKHPRWASTAIAATTDAVQQAHEQGVKVTKEMRLQIAAQIDQTPGYKGYLQFYKEVLTRPRVEQFKQTSVYKTMPRNMKERFDEIAAPAAKLAAMVAAEQIGTQDASRGWRKAVREQITPWLDDPGNKDLKKFLEPMGPNFLYTLVSGATPKPAPVRTVSVKGDGTALGALVPLAKEFDLRVSATTNGNHVENSYHYAGRAVDYVGDPANLAALAAYAVAHPAQYVEMFYTGPGNPGVFIKNGVVYPDSSLDPEVAANHTTHVHLAK